MHGLWRVPTVIRRAFVDRNEAKEELVKSRGLQGARVAFPPARTGGAVITKFRLTSPLLIFNQSSKDTRLKHIHILVMAPPKLKIGIAGLGRMGKRHALHFLNRTPRAELVAASSPDDAEIQWAKQYLEPFGVTLYNDYGEMLKHEGLQSIVIASVTTVHAEQAIQAMQAEKHVLCEKPLSTSVEIVGDHAGS